MTGPDHEPFGTQGRDAGMQAAAPHTSTTDRPEGAPQGAGTSPLHTRVAARATEAAQFSMTTPSAPTPTPPCAQPPPPSPTTSTTAPTLTSPSPASSRPHTAPTPPAPKPTPPTSEASPIPRQPNHNL